MTRADSQQLATLRITEAQALLTAGFAPGAYDATISTTTAANLIIAIIDAKD